MTPALRLAKELCLCAEINGVHVRPSQTTIALYERQLETFYRRAQALALRDAAAWFAPAGLYDAGRVKEHLRRMAAKLENQK